MVDIIVSIQFKLDIITGKGQAIVAGLKEQFSYIESKLGRKLTIEEQDRCLKILFQTGKLECTDSISDSTRLLIQETCENKTIVDTKLDTLMIIETIRQSSNLEEIFSRRCFIGRIPLARYFLYSVGNMKTMLMNSKWTRTEMMPILEADIRLTYSIPYTKNISLYVSDDINGYLNIAPLSDYKDDIKLEISNDILGNNVLTISKDIPNINSVFPTHYRCKSTCIIIASESNMMQVVDVIPMARTIDDELTYTTMTTYTDMTSKYGQSNRTDELKSRLSNKFPSGLQNIRVGDARLLGYRHAIVRR